MLSTYSLLLLKEVCVLKSSLFLAAWKINPYPMHSNYSNCNRGKSDENYLDTWHVRHVSNPADVIMVSASFCHRSRQQTKSQPLIGHLQEYLALIGWNEKTEHHLSLDVCHRLQYYAGTDTFISINLQIQSLTHLCVREMNVITQYDSRNQNNL